MANKFNYKRYKHKDDIDRGTYYYITGLHCGVNIRYAPVVETPLAYKRRMQLKEKAEAWERFVKVRGCHSHCNICEDNGKCPTIFEKTFVSHYVYKGEP